MGLPIRTARFSARMVGGIRPAGRAPDSFRAGGRPADWDRPSPARRQLRSGSSAGPMSAITWMSWWTPGGKRNSAKSLLDYVSREGVTRIELGPVRPDSAVMTGLVPHARGRGWPVASETEDVLFETDLPPSWEEYLDRLSGKQRHEVRRKLRRLQQSVTFAFRMVSGRRGHRRRHGRFSEAFPHEPRPTRPNS